MQRLTTSTLAIALSASRRENMAWKCTWKCLVALIVLLFSTLSTHAQTVGTSELIFDYEAVDSNDSALNVSLTTADGQLWYAVEWFDITNNLSALDLFWDDTTTITTPKTLSTGELGAGNAMYPGIVTWDAHEYVYVAGKADANPTSPQLKFFRQDRDNLLAGASTTTLGNAPVGTKHSRPHLTFDKDMGSGLGTDRMYVCWTAKNATEEDVKSKAKDPSVPWPFSPLHNIAVQNGTATDPEVTDDHCEQSFNHVGDRYTVYHSQAGGHGTWLHVDHWNPTTRTWNDIADFELLNAGGTSAITNFPSIATSADAYDTHHLVVAKRQNPAYDLISWTCDATVAGACQAAADWTYLRQSLTGTVHAPKAAVHNEDRYVLYEDRSGTPTLRLYKMCMGDTSWTEVGEIPQPDTNHTGAREFNANINSSAVSTFTVDRNNQVLHAIFVALKDGTSRYNPAHWELDISGGCAGL